MPINFFAIARFFLYVSVLSVAIVTPSTLFPFIVGKYVWFRSSIDFALIAFFLGILFDSNARFVYERFLLKIKNPLVITISVFVSFFLLAGFLGVNPSFSFWSNFERGEGGFQILHLYIFFLLASALFTEEKHWRKIFGWVLVGAVLMSLYGLFAALDVQNFVGARFGEAFRFQGSIGNPAYVAAYAIFALFYAAYLVFSKYKKKFFNLIPIVIYIISGGLLIVFFLAATRGAFIGLLAALCTSGIYIGWQRKSTRKILISVIAGILLFVGVGVYFKNTPFVQKLPVSRIFDISFSTETFEDRAIMWKSAIDGFKARPLLGWGPENFINIFDRHFNPRYFNPGEGFGAWFDRAHSVIFDYLAETGILGLLSFLSIFFVFFYLFFKRHKDGSMLSSQPIVVKAILLSFPVAYLVQGLALFDVLPIYMNLFLFLAFALFQFQIIQNQQQFNKKI